MSSNVYLDNIEKYLFQLVDLIGNSNSLNRNNKAVDAENLFRNLLNISFGWNLKNANENKKNQENFDLENTRRKLFVQVTSNKNHSQKFNSTIQKFKKNNSKHFSQLIVLFISKKCSDKLLKKGSTKSFQYEAYDIPKLFKTIYHNVTSAKKLCELNELLQAELTPVGIVTKLNEESETSTFLMQSAKKRSKGVYIKRDVLLEEIFSFGQKANGIIVGMPGVGKSFTIEELQRLCAKRRLPCAVIKINELVEATDKEIADMLNAKSFNWIRTLKRAYLKNNNHKAFLIFDAFDTAKDERIKSATLKHIQKAIKELSNNWTVLVSARTFDATKSIQLLEIFPNENINKSINCRNIEIPELSEVELLSSIKKHRKLFATYQESKEQFKKLLRTPYFLKLLESILNDINKAEEKTLSIIETEDQLLKIFWDKKVLSSTQTDVFLQELTKILTANENLSCKKDKIVNQSNFQIFDELLSLRILEESSVTKQNISYAHNILLDYAISIYLIPEDEKDLIDYVQTNQKVPFLFRQSFIYFYSRVWRVNINLFWKHYFIARNVNTPLFRLFHQTILNFVLSDFYSTVQDLEPLFYLKNDEERNNILRKVLEGLRFINKGSIREKDYDLMVRISEFISPIILWELGFLIDKAIVNNSATSNGRLVTKSAKASTNYLSYILNERRISTQKWLIDANGWTWAAQNFCRTFSLSKKDSKKLLKEVLSMLKEEDFPIRCFHFLSDFITQIFKYDTALGKLVYRTLYFHNETSNKETLLGGGVVMALRSNRRQDYELVHYKLEREFENILEIFAYAGVEMGLEIVDDYLINKKSSYYKKASIALSIDGVKVEMVQDFSFYETAHDKEHGPLSHLEKIFNYLEKLYGNRNETTAKNLVKDIIRNAKATSIWRRLLVFLTKHPKELMQISLSILNNDAIYVSNETLYETGELIKALWQFLSTAEKSRIENSIFQLSKSKFLRNDSELKISRIKRLLSCIPEGDLKNKGLLHFLSTLGKEVENKPLLTQPRLQPYHASDEEKLREAWVDPSNTLEMTAYGLIKKIEPFNKKYNENNKIIPLKSEYEPLITLVKELWEISKTQKTFNEKLIFTCDFEVSTFAKLVSRNGTKLKKAVRAFIDDIAYYYIEADRYKAVEYENGNIKNRWGAFTASPRTASALTFVHLLPSDKSKKMPLIVLQLMSDNIQAVRFQVLHVATYFWHTYRSLFWEVIRERVQKETDGMCLHEVIQSVCYDDIMKENRTEVETIAALAMNNLLQYGVESVFELWQIYVVLLLKLLIKNDSIVAKDLIYNNFQNKSFNRSLITEIMTVLDPRQKGNNYVSQPNKYNYLLDIISFIVEKRFENIHLKLLKAENANDDFEIIDFTIQQVYFTITNGKKSNKGKELDKQNKIAFYLKIKKLLRFIVDESLKIENGFMVAHTGYYFMQLLNEMLYGDAEFILKLSTDIVNCAAANNFTYDQSTLSEIVKLTEKLLADHKEMLSNHESFNDLITILDQFANSGWQEALELTWRLKDVF